MPADPKLAAQAEPPVTAKEPEPKQPEHQQNIVADPEHTIFRLEQELQGARVDLSIAEARWEAEARLSSRLTMKLENARLEIEELKAQLASQSKA